VTARAILVALALLTAVAWPASGALQHQTRGSAGRDDLLVGTTVASTLVPKPAYYRPVVADGKTFPVARSNYLSLIEFPDSWHAPRLRLVNGKWLLVGVHQGIDISAERGTPVLSMEAGVVENVGWTFYSGTRVGVRGVDARYYFYAHLSNVQPGIVVGARVSAGTVLGLVGNTGYGPEGHRDEFPPHLHFGIEVGAQWVNPYPTLVSLYAATVRTTERQQAALDLLASAGRRSAWRSMAGQTYMSLPPAGGE
jgi:murein DD-endopeptidase MepM/ murein hydrolase activator NlpD